MDRHDDGTPVPGSRVREAVRDWRDSLVNLTGTNRLLNFRPRRTTSVEIVRPEAVDILDRLTEGRTFQFRSIAPATDPETGETLPVPPPSPALLDTRKDATDLVAALRTLAHRSNQDYLDRGVWVLYLAFGTLRWSDDGDTYATSPLLLAPVRLAGTGVRQVPVLQALDEDPVVNPALALKMSQFGITLPGVDLLEDLSLTGLLGEVRLAVADQPRWQVRDDVILSYFSFHKEAMYRDLLDHEEAIARHPVVAALAAPGADGFLFDEVPPERIDAEAPPETTPLVLDADSSQRACVAAAVAGHSFVMDGPPGTGKSQTIANMIGALLHAGKSVLFVSEKAAALEVVRNRLTDVGLGSYLLELHSHKATRRQVAAALGTALDAVAVPPPAMNPLDRETVTQHRKRLNGYAEAMNRPREPLGYSLHEVLGRLALLHDVPAAPATGTAPVDLTVETYGMVRATAQALGRAWRPAVQGASFVWRGVTERASMDARLYRAASALEALAGTTQRNAPLADAFDLRRPSDAEALAALLDHIAARPAEAPSRWLTADSLDETLATASRLGADLAEIAAQEDATTEAAGVSWRALPDPATVPSAASVPSAAIGVAPLALDELTTDAAERLGATFARAAARLDTRIRSLSGITSMLGLPPIVTWLDAEDTLAVAGLGYVPDRPERAWLSATGYKPATEAAAALRDAADRLARAETAARACYTEAALDADVAGLAARFTTVHTGMRKLLGAYRQDKRAVAAFTLPGVSAQDAVGRLDLAVAWKRAAAALAEAEATHMTVLGSYYTGRTTDFDALARALANAEVAVRRARTTDLSRLADHVARDATPHPSLRDVVEDTRRDLDDWRAGLAPEPVPAAPPELLTVPLDDAVAWLRAQLGPLQAGADLARQLSRAVGRPLTVGQARHLLGLRAATDAAHRRLAEHAAGYTEELGTFYAGERTDMTAVRAALAWTERVRSLYTGTDAPLTPAQVKALVTAVPTPTLGAAAARWGEAKADLLAAFDLTRQTELASELDDYGEGADVLRALREDSAGKDEWFAHTEARAVLARHGLDVAVDFCVAERVPAEAVPQVIERALLQEWADHHLAHDPAFATFRAEDRDALVAEYRALDRTLVASSTSGIITAVNGRRPRTDIGQAGLVRREASKKKRHMPVRTLIERTSHVVQAVKPCFMMSPLAVSQFLPPDLTFDVVIFDEASQVSPGDAINCVYRGRALITAGDQKQLPPTAFFAAASDDGTDEWREDEETGRDFESVLDLAKASGAFRSLTLRWHYRSRHEGLIAFSNASFYDGNLVTFPGAEDDGANVGVELFKVDGTYRRGTSRDNPIEAAAVAERVIHHFDTRPHLTLGVVTFSDAQAAAIADALDLARLTRPDLDAYFTDDRLDGFFVKSLESAQGDERDVMIFSVGYGPDENGRITMNFGPVNRPGGWRRLNVAVTRARYRNEIVSSITAADITPGAGDGVRFLRDYLDYAARGTPALALDAAERPGAAPSPFEESVAAAIRSWGYRVTARVGAAGYRIDIGVHHPEHPGLYALGVECDGFMYHSAKVARDRDRLREQVLCRLGWRLHRVWGAAWYRDRSGEEERLRAAIEAAVAAPRRGLPGLVPGGADDERSSRPAVTTEPAAFDATPAWAVPYRFAQVDRLPRWVDPADPGARHEMRTGIEQVAATEAPVHVSVVHQRLREAWDVGRITPRIREHIDAAIELANVIRDGDFVLAAGPAEVIVRTPVEGCARTIDQVHDDELAVALVNLVRDTGGIDQDELTAAVTRLYGWGRRGSDIAARLDALVGTLTADGTLASDRQGLTLASKPPAAPVVRPRSDG